MNAYIASFMLLLFNAVGLAVPASAAAEERMIPELGSAANLADTLVAGQSAAVESTAAVLPDHRSAESATIPDSTSLADDAATSRKPVWAVVAIRSETGDKLEHEEGAP